MFEALTNNHAHFQSESESEGAFLVDSDEAPTLSQVINRIDFLNAQIEKIESVTGPSFRTLSFRKEISHLEKHADQYSA